MITNINPSVAQKPGRSKYQKLTGVIAFSRIFADVAGCACGGLFLSQADYWSQRALESSELSEGWFTKSAREWEEKTALNRREQDKVRAHLEKLGVIEKETGGHPRTTSYRVNYEVLDECIDAVLEGTYKGTRPKNPKPQKSRSERDLAYIQFVHSEQTKLVRSEQTESDKGFSVFSNDELKLQFVHSEQTKLVHSEQTEFVHSEQTDYIYKIKENSNITLSKTRTRENEEKRGDASLCDLKILNEQDKCPKQQSDSITVKSEVVQDYSKQDDLLENLSVNNKIIHESKCSAAPPPQVENETTTNKTVVSLNDVQDTQKRVNEERYTRTVEPGLKRNLDGSVCLPWQIQGQRFKYDAEFEAWMCQKMSNTTFYKKLTAGAALTQVRKHISNASYDNQRRDELMIEWEAMQASRLVQTAEAPASEFVIHRSSEMPVEVAAMTVEEIKKKQRFDEQIKRLDIHMLQEKACAEFMEMKGINKMNGKQLKANYPNWHQDMVVWVHENYPELQNT